MHPDWFLLIPLSGVVLLLAAGWRRGGEPSPREVSRAAQDCALLLRLLALLQQHRGASAAWLAGDAAFAARRRGLQQEIDALWPGLHELARRESDHPRSCFTAHDWSLFQFRWNGLLDGLAHSSAADAIHAHTQLIGRLLDWLAALGEARIEAVAGRRLPTGLVSDYAHRLPALTECLGQARALGAAVATAGHCAPVARVRLGFLAARAESLLLATRRADRPRSAEQAQRAVEELLAILRRQILDGTRVGIDAESYFATATRAIDAVFVWIGCHGDTLQGQARGRRITEPARSRPLHGVAA